MPWPPLLALPFNKKNKWCHLTEICQTLWMVFVADGVGQIQVGGLRGMYPPHYPFSTLFLMKKNIFFIILNLFDNNKPYASSTHI